MHQNVLDVEKVRFSNNFLLNPTNTSKIPGITPVEGTEETVRVVSMDKDFHIDCYICENCGMQLTDEQDKRCYPYEETLLCRACHIEKLATLKQQRQLVEPVAATFYN